MKRQFTTALIVGGGKGARMGEEINKVFLPLGGKPILVHTLSVFEASPEVDAIVLVCRAGEEARVQEMAAPFSKLRAVVAGGDTRRASVQKGLSALPKETELVAIHDAARPFLTQKALLAVIRAADEHAAAALGVPSKDTVKICDESGRILQTPDRRTVWNIQTPQVFRKEIILAAHCLEADVTDDCSLVEKLGTSVLVVPGSYTNIKITTPEDLVVAQALYEKQEKCFT